MTAASFLTDRPACDLWAFVQSEKVTISVPWSHLVNLQVTCCPLQTPKHTQVLTQLKKIIKWSRRQKQVRRFLHLRHTFYKVNSSLKPAEFTEPAFTGKRNMCVCMFVFASSDESQTGRDVRIHHVHSPFSPLPPPPSFSFSPGVGCSTQVPSPQSGVCSLNVCLHFELVDLYAWMSHRPCSSVNSWCCIVQNLGGLLVLMLWERIVTLWCQILK